MPYQITMEDLFNQLYQAKNEDEVTKIISKHPDVFKSENWSPFGGNESNFSIVENQQSNPVAALVEKITNSIDAILMRKCYEAGIDPKSSDAPRSVEKAVAQFFPEHKDWDLHENRNKQAQSIQILADSLPKDTANTSIIIYDDGEGQHPQDFEDTFLSLIRGNKNEVHFVQGKYNMGGTGALVFCGKHRYQLIASKKYSNDGMFGFTLIRKHPLSIDEQHKKKSTWYEYFKFEGNIPAFHINELELNLHRTKFTTGTIIKLYSYDTKGNRNLKRDMGRSLNEFLYKPALPFYLVERPERYPNMQSLHEAIFGLRYRLDKNEHVDPPLSDAITGDPKMGDVKITVHVFKTRTKNKSVTETRNFIQEEFFRNNMAVMFSVNGQVHGHYTSEFITRSLKYNLLKDYLLIHVDCSNMRVDFRTELFMASRDRLKQSIESKHLREELTKRLNANEQLKEIYKKRKDSISVDHAEQNSLLQDFANNLPINQDLHQLLGKVFKLEQNDPVKKKPEPSKSKPEPKKVDFNPQRYPSFFKFGEKSGNTDAIKIPLNGSKSIQFDSDVENQFFDRVDDAGDLQIAIMDYKPNENTGGNKKGTANEISDLLTVSRKSPQDGKIKVVFEPKDNVQVGDEIQIKADLNSPVHPEGQFQHIFWVKITEPSAPKVEKVEIPEEDKLGLPNCVSVHQSASSDQPNIKTWQNLEDAGIDMSYEIVMYPDLKGDILETIYINMDSRVFKSYLSTYRNLTVEQEQVARNKYISSVYFHTIFLYLINKNKGYLIAKDDKDIELGEYLQDVFSSYYADFLLKFGMKDLMEGLG